MTITALTVDSSQQTVTTAIIVYKDQQYYASEYFILSHCQSSDLEVYRGREQAIEINHEGFSLSDGGTIEVGL